MCLAAASAGQQQAAEAEEGEGGRLRNSKLCQEHISRTTVGTAETTICVTGDIDIANSVRRN